jgi:hypothetical protein
MRSQCCRRHALAAALGAIALLAAASPSSAKTVHQSPYTYRQTFGSALRLVKVDLGYTVTESDADWGYLVFEYTSTEAGKRKIRGSFQFVELRESVQVTLELASMPSYHEQVVLTKLRRKLEEEHGDPPERPRPPKPDKDRNKDKDKDKDKDDDGGGDKREGDDKPEGGEGGDRKPDVERGERGKSARDKRQRRGR